MAVACICSRTPCFRWAHPRELWAADICVLTLVVRRNSAFLSRTRSCSVRRSRTTWPGWAAQSSPRRSAKSSPAPAGGSSCRRPCRTPRAAATSPTRAARCLPRTRIRSASGRLRASRVESIPEGMVPTLPPTLGAGCTCLPTIPTCRLRNRSRYVSMLASLSRRTPAVLSAHVLLLRRVCARLVRAVLANRLPVCSWLAAGRATRWTLPFW